jgi:RimJ/RimL family protein N-acetyltransferase
MSEFHLATERLVLRSWRLGDRDPFAAMNADPAVMEFFESPLTRSQSDDLAQRFEVELASRGFCPWAVEEPASGAFIGFVGLHEVSTTLTFSPAVEVGWRLDRPFWGRGYATEAAAASLRFGFETVGVDEIVSMTAVANLRSSRVMERLGMSRDPDGDFEHPSITTGHALRPHVLYRLGAAEWRRRAHQ